MRLPGKPGMQVLHSLRARGFERPVAGAHRTRRRRREGAGTACRCR
jgi:hypothetical protein